MLEAELSQQLRHLRDVAEHVGQVADLHRPTERRGAVEPDLQVAHDGLARHEELVHEDVPRADGDPSRGGEAAQRRLGLRPHGEVVVDDRHLPVEQEVDERRIGIE